MFTEDIKTIGAKIFSKIVELRRELHKYPEIGFKEYKTSSIIVESLKSLGLEVKTGVAGTGVVALLRGPKPGKTVAIRADIDALPIIEMNDLEYVSQHPGFMHACGHDAHIAAVLGAAEILCNFKDKLHGNIKFVFQPAEEGLGGAKIMIEEGVLEKPDVNAIIAAHVSPAMEAGSISVCFGPALASNSEFEIEIKGKGGHAAEPLNTINPIIPAANIVTRLNSLNTYDNLANKKAVVAITSFNAESAINIIPDTAMLKGTIRTFDPELDNHLEKMMNIIVKEVAEEAGTSYSISYNKIYPAVINNNEMVDHLITSSRRILDSDKVLIYKEPEMISEDFSFYAQKVSGVYFKLGCSSNKNGIREKLHNCRFNIDEKCILTGMEVFSQFALDFLEKMQ